MPKLRFAQAGVTALHATMYRETLGLLADEIELVGFYDPDPTGAQASLDPAHADLPFHDSIAALIAATRPDAILVSTFCREMPNWMAQVAGAGIHLWAEKPCAATSGQLAPAAEALARNRLLSSCGYSGASTRSRGWSRRPLTPGCSGCRIRSSSA